jgi:hypothetical protein
LHIFKGKFDYSNSLTLENKILIVASIFLSDGILGVTVASAEQQPQGSAPQRTTGLPEEG